MTARHAIRVLRAWLGDAPGRGLPRSDHLAVHGLLRHELTEAEVEHLVATLVLRTGHSAGDPIGDDDIRAIIETLVYPGADEGDVYRVREAMSRAGRALVPHT